MKYILFLLVFHLSSLAFSQTLPVEDVVYQKSFLNEVKHEKLKREKKFFRILRESRIQSELLYHSRAEKRKLFIDLKNLMLESYDLTKSYHLANLSSLLDKKSLSLDVWLSKKFNDFQQEKFLKTDQIIKQAKLSQEALDAKLKELSSEKRKIVKLNNKVKTAKTEESIKKNFLLPLKGILENRFGWSEQSDQIYLNSSGVYLRPGKDKKVKAAYGGIVETIYSSNDTFTVILKHKEGLRTIYSDLYRVAVDKDFLVSKSQTLGEVKDKLYFEVRNFENAENPEDWFLKGQL